MAHGKNHSKQFQSPLSSRNQNKFPSLTPRTTKHHHASYTRPELSALRELERTGTNLESNVQLRLTRCSCGEYHMCLTACCRGLPYCNLMALGLACSIGNAHGCHQSVLTTLLPRPMVQISLCTHMKSTCACVMIRALALCH